MFELKKCPNLGSVIYPINDPLVGKSIATYSESNALEAEFLTSLVVEGDCVIDAGAYIGTLTLPLARKVGPTGRVIAFECQRAIYYLLCGNVALNELHKTIEVLPHAAYVVSGQRAFMPEMDYAEPAVYGMARPTTEKTALPTTTMRIDDLNLSKLKLLKVDVMGMEWDVIRGADATVRSCRPFIYFESVATLGYELSVSICEHLEKLGYEWRAHEPPVFNPNNVENVEENILKNDVGNVSFNTNIFAFPREQERNITQVLENEYFVDLESSDKVRHKAFCEARKERDAKRKADGRTIII